MKRLYMSIAAVITTAFLATACGGGDSETPTGEPKVTRTEVAPNMYELAYSSNQKLVYAVSSGGSGDNPEPSKLFWLHPDTLAIQGELNLPVGGFGLDMDDTTGRIYMTNTRDGSMTIVDTKAKKVLDVPQLAPIVDVVGRDGKPQPKAAHKFREARVDTARGRVYLPGIGEDIVDKGKDSALYVYDTKGMKLQTVIPGFGEGRLTGITLSPKGDKIYVSNMIGQLFTVDATSLKIEHTSEPEGEVLLNLAFDSRHGHVLSTDRKTESRDRGAPGVVHPKNADQILVIDPATGKTLAHMPSDAGPVTVMVDPTRNLAYATNRNGGSVTVYNTNTHEKVNTVSLPTYPNSLALNPSNGVIYVTVKNDRSAPAGSKESVARISLFN